MGTVPNRRELVVIAILSGGELYGREIRDEVELRTGMVLPLGSLYTTLIRMEEKKLVKSRNGKSGPDGGNHRRYYSPTIGGRAALAQAQVWVAARRAKRGDAGRPKRKREKR